MDFFEYLIIIVPSVMFGLSVGNALGDQATLRDCAIKSEAKLVGGGTIECTVKKETK